MKAKYLIILCFMFAGCSPSSENENRDEERMLATETMQASKAYIDSLKIAKDSASVSSLMQNYESIITRIYYSHTPDLYLNLSESENDSITKLTMRILSLRDSLLYRFAHPLPAPSLIIDSIPTDSIDPPAV